MDTNPMEMVLVSEHDMMFSEVQEEKVEMSNILLEDKLFRDFSAARIMLKEIEQSLTTIPELDML
jgi:predicted RNA-binding protein